MDISNKTRRPISIPLPGGKKLFLGPGKTGQITAKSAEHPPLVELVEAGDLEIGETSRRQNAASDASVARTGVEQGSASTANIRRTGDR